MHHIRLQYLGYPKDLTKISIELRMDDFLLGQGSACDPAINQKLEQRLVNYNRRYKDYPNVMHPDNVREAYLAEVLKENTSRICNHLNLLTCAPSGVCECRDTLVWVIPSGRSKPECLIKSGQPCGEHGPDRKMFEFFIGETDWASWK